MSVEAIRFGLQYIFSFQYLMYVLKHSRIGYGQPMKVISNARRFAFRHKKEKEQKKLRLS
jgi:hypothetical protein